MSKNCLKKKLAAIQNLSLKKLGQKDIFQPVKSHLLKICIKMGNKAGKSPFSSPIQHYSGVPCHSND